MDFHTRIPILMSGQTSILPSKIQDNMKFSIYLRKVLFKKKYYWHTYDHYVAFSSLHVSIFPIFQVLHQVGPTLNPGHL